YADENEDVALLDPLVVAGIGELEGKDAEVDEVLPVDAGEVLGDDASQPEEAWGDRRVLPARALAVVLAADDEVAAGVADFEGPLGERLVDGIEHELGHLGDVAPEREHPLTGRHDLVGRHVVADLQQYGALDAFGQRLEVGQGRDVRALDQLHTLAGL